MPAIDSCEPQVIRALAKEGWTIYRKPHTVKWSGTTLYIDFSIQRGDSEILIVEVKCFPDSSSIRDEIYRAVGQYSAYKGILQAHGTTYPLYLAIPDFIYDTILEKADLKFAVELASAKLVICNLEQEQVVQWID